MKNKNSFIVYHDQAEIFNELDDKDAGRLIKQMFTYSKSKQLLDLPKYLKMAFIPIKQQMDRNESKYKEISKLRSKFGQAGGLAKASKSKQLPRLLSKAAVKDKDKDKDNIYNRIISIKEKEIAEIAEQYSVSEKSVRDVLEELRLYCESTGKKYKNYKAALQNWIRRNLESKKISRVEKMVVIDLPSEDFDMTARIHQMKKDHGLA